MDNEDFNALIIWTSLKTFLDIGTCRIVINSYVLDRNISIVSTFILWLVYFLCFICIPLNWLLFYICFSYNNINYIVISYVPYILIVCLNYNSIKIPNFILPDCYNEPPPPSHMITVDNNSIDTLPHIHDTTAEHVKHELTNVLSDTDDVALHTRTLSYHDMCIIPYAKPIATATATATAVDVYDVL